MIRKLLIAAVALVLVLGIAVDRVGAHVAAHVLSGKLESDEHLADRPSVTIGGIPFLTQAWRGFYDDIKVTTHDFITADHLELDTMTVYLLGVHIPRSDVIKGSVSKVPVDRLKGSVFVSFVDIEAYLAARGANVKLSETPKGAIGVVGESTHLGPFPRLLNGVATVSIDNSVLTLSVGLNKTGTKVFKIPVPLRGLPFRITVDSVTVAAGGITGTGTAHNVVLGS
jgi:hypothetical protein